MTTDGFYGEDGRPVFLIEVYGHSSDWKVPINAILDTGFSGFLDLPLEYCLKAGLVLATTTAYTLADGRSSSTLLCWGTIVLGEKRVVGLISISTGRHALLGIEFLKKSGLKLEIDPLNNITKLV